jgi:hypothetical protein
MQESRPGTWANERMQCEVNPPTKNIIGDEE